MDRGGELGGRGEAHGLYSRQLMAAGTGRVIFLSKWGLGKLPMLQWMPRTREHMGNTNWTQWVIKKKIRKQKT